MSLPNPGRSPSWDSFQLRRYYTADAVLDHYESLGRHADCVLFMPHVPWRVFEKSSRGISKEKQEMVLQNWIVREQDQIGYLEAVNSQLGEELAMWIYLLLQDIDYQGYGRVLKEEGLRQENIQTLGLFASVGLKKLDGTPKPAMRLWDLIREQRD